MIPVFADGAEWLLAVKAQWVSTLARYRAPAEALPQEGMPA